jgi:hypothetical protein
MCVEVYVMALMLHACLTTSRTSGILISNAWQKYLLSLLQLRTSS